MGITDIIFGKQKTDPNSEETPKEGGNIPPLPLREIIDGEPVGPNWELSFTSLVG